VKNSPLWKSDPDQQLGYYSARSWARRHFPELLLGVYTQEEMAAAPPRDITPQEPTAMQRKIAAAKAEAEAKADIGKPKTEIEDHEELPEELPEEPTADHWNVDFDTSEDFPGDDDWDEGMKAFSASMKRSMCPHEDDPKAAANWLGGYDGARKAAT